MEVKFRDPAPPRESARESGAGKLASGAAKLRALKFLPKTDAGREAAKQRIKSKKQVNEEDDAEANKDDPSEDKDMTVKAKLTAIRAKTKPKKKSGVSEMTVGAAEPPVLPGCAIALCIMGSSF